MGKEMLENSESVYTYVNNFLLEQAFFCTAVLLPELATADLILWAAGERKVFAVKLLLQSKKKASEA